MIDVKSPLLEKEAEQKDTPDYSDTEESYLRGLRKRLETARNARDTSHDEFDGMDYITYYNQNERLANTYIEPKKNKQAGRELRNSLQTAK